MTRTASASIRGNVTVFPSGAQVLKADAMSQMEAPSEGAEEVEHAERLTLTFVSLRRSVADYFLTFVEEPRMGHWRDQPRRPVSRTHDSACGQVPRCSPSGSDPHERSTPRCHEVWRC